MKDKIIRAVAKDGMVRIIAGITTNLVENARVIHECTPVACSSTWKNVNSWGSY